MTDRSRAGAEGGIEVKEFAPTLAKKLPNGPCFSKDGFLYVVEQNRVLQYPAAEFFYEGPDVAVSEVVPEGQLIPKAEESFNHTARECRVGPDGKLYIQLGQPYNVPPKEKVELYKKVGMGGIIRMDQDGKNREVYATGLRNPVGFDFNPKDKTLWSQRQPGRRHGRRHPAGRDEPHRQDGRGIRLPVVRRRAHAHQRIQERNAAGRRDFPEVEQVAHAADLGLSFYTGDMFPAKYKGAIFSTQHGSWNRTVPVGARVMVTFLKDDGHVAGPSIPFAEGWNDNGHYLGRPVDVQQYWDGSLLVSDDLVGAVYRIWYDGKVIEPRLPKSGSRVGSAGLTPDRSRAWVAAALCAALAFVSVSGDGAGAGQREGRPAKGGGHDAPSATASMGCRRWWRRRTLPARTSATSSSSWATSRPASGRTK